MSQIKTLNGVQYTLPQYNDTAWGANTGNVLTQYLAAIADVTLQLSGGSFTLTADVDFGANFGLKALFLKSETVNPASAGVVRLAKTDSVAWRNNANGADKLLNIDVSDNLQYASTKVLLSGAVVNADINASAAIAYSKLSLAGSVVNADIATGAAIAYSKLALTGSVVNADIGASAAIALSKLAALGTAKALQSNSSTGLIEVSAVTTTELGYVSGVTSAIQTQINATIKNPAVASISFNPTTLGIVGTTTNDNTAAGNVGEAIRSVVTSGSPVGPTTGTYVNITSISLTAGDWDVTGIAVYGANSGTGLGRFTGVVSAFSGNTTTDHVIGDNAFHSTETAADDLNIVIPTWRVSISGTTTIYLKGNCTFSGGTIGMYGRISARRVR